MLVTLDTDGEVEYTKKERGYLVKETQEMESRRGGRRRSKGRTRHFKERQTDPEMGWVPSWHAHN